MSYLLLNCDFRRSSLVEDVEVMLSLCSLLNNIFVVRPGEVKVRRGVITKDLKSDVIIYSAF